MDTKLSSDMFISKFIIKGKPVYVKLLWKQNEHELFQIKIFDGDSSWSGRLSNEFAEKYRERVDESEVEYRVNVKKVLRSCDNDFVYEFTPVPGDSNSATFSWKRRFDGGVLLHGSVPVQRYENLESKDILIDFLLLENRVLKQSIEEYNRKNEDLSGDLEKCKSELEKFVKIKTTLETSLYGKFVQLLNSKKRRINLLEENLQKFETMNNTIKDNELD